MATIAVTCFSEGISCNLTGLHTLKIKETDRLEALKEERKAAGIGGRVPQKKKVIKESDWKTYYGSQEDIKKLVRSSKPEDWSREILDFVPTKKLLTYYEIKHIFINNALEDSDFLNDNILGKFYQKDFK